jgi:hypothetical protein
VPVFTCEGMGADGKRVKMQVTATDAEEAGKKLAQEGVFPLWVQEEPGTAGVASAEQPSYGLDSTPGLQCAVAQRLGPVSESVQELLAQAPRGIQVRNRGGTDIVLEAKERGDWGCLLLAFACSLSLAIGMVAARFLFEGGVLASVMLGLLSVGSAYCTWQASRMLSIKLRTVWRVTIAPESLTVQVKRGRAVWTDLVRQRRALAAVTIRRSRSAGAGPPDLWLEGLERASIDLPRTCDRHWLGRLVAARYGLPFGSPARHIQAGEPDSCAQDGPEGLEAPPQTCAMHPNRQTGEVRIVVSGRVAGFPVTLMFFTVFIGVFYSPVLAKLFRGEFGGVGRDLLRTWLFAILGPCALLGFLLASLWFFLGRLCISLTRDSLCLSRKVLGIRFSRLQLPRTSIERLMAAEAGELRLYTTLRDEPFGVVTCGRDRTAGLWVGKVIARWAGTPFNTG